MTNYLIFGLGMMGEAILADILEHDDQAFVHGVEINPKQITKTKILFEDENNRLKIHHLSIIENEEEIKNILDSVDVAFGAIDYKFNVRLSQYCIQTKTHFLDLGGNPEVVEEQYNLSREAKKNGVTIIPDCGLAPGMVNIIAANLLNNMDSPEECHIRVGGLPHSPRGILQYQQVFSIRGLTNEYIENAIVIQDGVMKEVPSLTELEVITFPQPFGEMEAFQTAGGTSSLPRLFQGRITELTYKTIRYPGHMQYFKFLTEFELLSEDPFNGVTPRELIEYKLAEYLPELEQDVVLIRIIVIGTTESQKQIQTWECIDYMDVENNRTAMARTTAYPISIIGQLIANDDIQIQGVQPGEIIVPFEQFMIELEKRDIRFKRSTETMY